MKCEQCTAEGRWVFSKKSTGVASHVYAWRQLCAWCSLHIEVPHMPGDPPMPDA